MRIPEASVNSGQYYTEDNQQWQNGAVMEGGPPHPVPAVEGYAHPPHMYPSQRPPHMPPGPGYMVPGAPYYGGYGVVPAPMVPPPADDFADYMWMENEEEFDKQVMQQLEEEALMEQCIEAMLEDERERLNGHTSNGQPSVSLEEKVSKSTLNPLAAEFVPTFSPCAAPTPANKTQPVEVSANDTVSDDKDKLTEPSSRSDTTEEVKLDESESAEKPKSPTTSKTEEAKKADQKETKKDKSKTEGKATKSDTKSSKPEVKVSNNEVNAAKPELKTAKVESKPAAVKPKSEPKVTAPKTTKKDVKTIRAEPKSPAPSAATKEQPKAIETEAPGPATAEPAKNAGSATESAAVMKPINYAAAARAGKPRKSTDSTPNTK